MIRAIAAEPGRGLHRLNDPSRTWPETNCYLDLWIGLLHAVGQDPVPLMGVVAGMAWEGDHFTFVKPGSGALFDVAGIVLQELALWDDMEQHVVVQVSRGAVPMPEVDAFFLPDAAGYGQAHSKTTIGITGIDVGARALEYVHNGGFFRLGGRDYCGVLGLAPHETVLFPYAEVARLPAKAPATARSEAVMLLWRLHAQRGPGNPVRAFAAALPGMLARHGAGEQVHGLCFNTARQLGAGFGLLADHLMWLDGDGSAAAAVSEQAKTLQFQLARAARRGRVDAGLESGLEALAEGWEAAIRQVAEVSGVGQLVGEGSEQ